MRIFNIFNIFRNSNKANTQRDPLRVIELFGGIGACTQALKRLGIPFEVVDYVEIDKYACRSYNAINGTNFKPQDICTYDKDIKADLIMHGSPCQDFSVAGYLAGGDEGSGTRSSLMWETVRIVGNIKPKYVIWENVKNATGKKNRHNFEKYLDKLESIGYQNYWQILNAKDYGVAQNRERVFVVSIRNDVAEKPFEFPQPMELKYVLADYLDAEVDAKYYINNEMADKLIDTLLADNLLPDGGCSSPIDLTINQPKSDLKIANCIIARYDRGISRRKKEGVGVVQCQEKDN